MKLSFTLDEKIFKEISPELLIEKAHNHGVSASEVSPDLDILDLMEYKKIVNIASQNNIDLNYHIPYFANELYEIEHFSLYEDKVKEKYISFINLLERFQEKLTNVPVIVIHGSNYAEDNKSKAMDNYLRFLDWMLNIFAKRNLPFTIALETLRKKDIRNTLDNREDIFSILKKFDCDNLKICWDICHDKMNFYPDATSIDDNFLNKIVYAHIHGHDLKSDISHVSLESSNLNYNLEIESLLKSSFKRTINIELLSNFSTDYLEDLFLDIRFMNQYIK